jgi:N utilization substance protein B
VSESHTERHLARETALQWLYQWEVGRLDLDEVFDASRRVVLQTVDPALEARAEALVRGTAGSLDRIDPLIAECSAHWRLERLNLVDRLILRLATYELLAGTPDASPAVVIDEAIELARTFSTEESAAFVNGVLDAIRRTIEADAKR